MKVCDALVQIGHELRLVVPAEGPRASWDDLARHYGIRHPFELQWLPSLKSLRRLDFVWYAHLAARKFGAHIAYTWLPQMAAVESWFGKPVILEMHANVAGRAGPWWLRALCKQPGPRRLLVTTEALKTALERSIGLRLSAQLVQVAPNGVDLERYAALPSPQEARRQLSLAEGLTVGFTGHFYEGRGIALLFEIARALPDLHFLWVGGTPEAVQDWRSRLAAAGQDNVTVTGFIDNSQLPLYQAAADILLMPYGQAVSASSGQDIAEVINPMKMFEYMAAGRPIITSDLPPIREVLDDTRAFFCPPDDPARWAAAIKDLASDPDRRAELARNARREVEQYTWEARARRALENFT